MLTAELNTDIDPTTFIVANILFIFTTKSAFLHSFQSMIGNDMFSPPLSVHSALIPLKTQVFSQIGLKLFDSQLCTYFILLNVSGLIVLNGLRLHFSQSTTS